VSALDALLVTYNTAWTAYKAPNHGPADTLAKNETRDAYKKALRAFVNERLRFNSAVTDVDKQNAGLTIPSGTRVPEEPPTTRPEADILYALRQLTIRFRDEGAVKWAKPPTVHGVVICWAILDQPPETIAELVHSAFDTKSPYVFDFEENQRKKTFYCVLRWENGKAGKGPWSVIYNAVIP
jgi:hypothetical protein